MSTMWHSCISNPVLPPPHHHPVEPACCILRPPHILLRLTHPPAQNYFLLCITPFPSVFSNIRNNVTIMLFRRYVTIICPTPTPPLYLHVVACRLCAPLDPLRKPTQGAQEHGPQIRNMQKLRAAEPTPMSAQDTQEPTCTPPS